MYLGPQSPDHIQLAVVSMNLWRRPDVNTKFQGTMQINAENFFSIQFRL